MPVTFKTGSWSAEKITDCRNTLNELFFAAVGKGEKRMNPHAVQILDKDRVDIAETIVNLIQEDITAVDPLPLLVNQVEGDIRNDYIWQQLDSSLRVTQRAYGAKPTSQRLQFREYGMSTTQKEVAVEIPLEEVFSGRQTPALAAQEMAVAIGRYRVQNTLDLIDAAVPAATNDRSSVSGYTLRYVESGALTSTNLSKAIDGLRDEGDDVTVVARHISLFPAIRGFSNLGVEFTDQLAQRGVIGTFNGANLLTLKDPYIRRTADHVIRKDRVYVSGGIKGCLYMTKPVDFLNYAYTDARTATFGTGIRMEDGLMMYDAYKYRIIELSI